VLLTCRISSGALGVTNRLGTDAMNDTENGPAVPAVPAAGWVAALVPALVGVGLSLGAGVLVDKYDPDNLALGVAILIYCCVYEVAHIFAQWMAEHISPARADRYDETLYHVQLTFQVLLGGLIIIWVGRAIFGLLSSAPIPAWVIALTIVLVVYAALEEGPAVQPTATSDAGDLIWPAVVAVFAVIFVLWMVFRDDDTPASATETTQAAPTTETISTSLSVGDSGPDVVILQERLAAEGLPVTVDGVYGPETADAVLAFQEQEQLTVDGVVGSETAEALGISSG
jgi:uncharacterized membrane protein